MPLPVGFLSRFKKFFPDEAEALLEAGEQPAFRGIRTNTLKISPSNLADLLGPDLIRGPVPFCPQGFYIPSDVAGLGNHSLHLAGAFYMQEPSAMSAAAALHPQPGERVLDLCAAPGGKSGQLAAALEGRGVLVANEFIESRARILSSNLERMGVSNCLVTSMRPDALCSRLAGWFDRVLVDAPCSGEGMLRREPAVAENWSLENIQACAVRQAKILDSAAIAVRPGGWLCYSTCTFAPEENEQMVAAFLARHPEFFLNDIEGDWGQPARPELAPGCPELEKARRILPRLGGEGHFVALLRRDESAGAILPTVSPAPRRAARSPKDRLALSGRDEAAALALFQDFWKQTFRNDSPGEPLWRGEQLYLLPMALPPLDGLRIIRAGLPAGHVTGRRFVPAHALFAAAGSIPLRSLDFPVGHPTLAAFLQGAEIPAENLEPGYAAVRVDGITLGFGKVSGGVLKNHYPKGLRLP